MKISEKQLRGIIKESIANYLLLEHDPDEFENWYGDDTPDVSSFVVFYFNPETFKIVTTRRNWKDGYMSEHPELGFCFISSTDFPDAWSHYDPGNSWTPPEFRGEVGKCGGDFEVDEFSMPDQYDDEHIEEWEAKFIELNREIILNTLPEYAEFV